MKHHDMLPVDQRDECQSPLPVRRGKRNDKKPSSSTLPGNTYQSFNIYCNPCFDVTELGNQLQAAVGTLTDQNILTNQEMKRTSDTAQSTNQESDRLTFKSETSVTKDGMSLWNLKQEEDPLLYGVMKQTMGENPDSNTHIADSHLDTREKTGYNDLIIDCTVGPFAKKPVVVLSGDSISVASTYIRSTFAEVIKYVNEGYVFYANQMAGYHGMNVGVAITHGGLGMMVEDGHRITNSVFPSYESSIHSCMALKMKDAKEDVDENTFHQLGFGGMITERLAPHKYCFSKKHALDAMHPDLRTTVVGHTPQPTGLVTILTEQKDFSFNQKHLICTDTQYKNRKDNTSATLVFKDGSFVGKGTWLGNFEYEYASYDMLIGTRVRIPNDAIQRSDTPYFRIVGKIISSPNDNELKGMYVCVNFPNIYRGNIYAGVPKIAFVEEIKYELSDGCVARRYKLHNVESNDIILMINNAMMEVLLPNSSMDSDCIVKQVDDHIYTSISNCMAHTRDINKFRHDMLAIVGGDIEGSPDFLLGFLKHTCDLLLDVDYNDPSIKKDEDLDMSQYNGFESSGFKKDALDDTHRMIFHLSSRILELTKENADYDFSMVCIGDCNGNPLYDDKACMLDNYVCMLWANHFCRVNVIGNRELNKLRLFSEIPNAIRPSNKWGVIELCYTAANPGLAEERERKDKSILASFCYPVVKKGGKWVSKHPGLSSVTPVLSHNERTSPWPGRTLNPVWKPLVDKLDAEEQEVKEFFLHIVKKAKKPDDAANLEEAKEAKEAEEPAAMEEEKEAPAPAPSPVPAMELV